MVTDSSADEQAHLAGEPELPPEGGLSWPSRTAIPWLLILALASFFCFALRNERPGRYKGDELYYMVGALNMVETGDWLIPRYHRRARLQKPPLNYWLIAVSYRMFGVGTWQGRLPSALAGSLAVALTYLFGLSLFSSQRSGLYGACALLACYAFMSHAHRAMTDVVLTLFVLGAFCGFAVAIFSHRAWGAPLAWVSTAGACLQKGPVGAIVPLAAVVAWMLVYSRTRGVKWRRVLSPLGIALFLLIVMPWPILVLQRLGKERVLASMGYEAGQHLAFEPLRLLRGPIRYTVAVLRGIFPWSLLLLFYGKRSRLSPPAALLWLWGIATVALYAFFIEMVRARYIMPAMPAFALLAGHALAKLESSPRQAPWLRRCFSWGVEGILLGGVLAGILLLPAACILVGTASAVTVAFLLLCVSLGAWLLTHRLRAASRSPDWVVAAALGIGLVQLLYFHVWGTEWYTSAAHDLARAHLKGHSHSAVVVELTEREASLASIGAGRPIPRLARRNQDAEGVDWQKALAFDRMITNFNTWTDMPREARERYERMDAMTSTDMKSRFHLLWFLEEAETSAQQGHGGQRTLVLLRLKGPAGGG